MQEEPEQITRAAWFDKLDGSITFCIAENLVYTLTLAEFSELYQNIEEIFLSLSQHESVIVGEIMDKDPESLRKILMIKPEESEIN